MDRSAQHAQKIVETALETSVEHCERAQGGAVSETFVVTLDTESRRGDSERLDGEPQRVVCKLGGANIWTGDVVEPHVVELVRRKTDLPVPTVLASGSLRRTEFERYRGDSPTDRWALYEFLDGTSPRETAIENRRTFVTTAGELLGRLHSAFRFDRIGGFVRATDGLRVSEPTSRNLLASPLGRLPSLVTDERGVSTGDGHFADSVDHRPVLDHGDYHPGNLLVEGSEITAVLDWGNAHVTDPEYALARAEIRLVDFADVTHSERRQLRQAFRDGYARHASLAPSYRDRAPVYRGLWLAQSGLNLGAIATTSRGRGQLWRQLKNWFSRRELF